MTWNYRVMLQVLKDGSLSYGIHEVHYDDLGRTTGWTTEPMEPNGKTFLELKKDYKLMREAFRAPVLSYHDGKIVKKGVQDVKVQASEYRDTGRRDARQVGPNRSKPSFAGGSRPHRKGKK